MKKTVTINISGIIFHIDEDAYDKLDNYLATIKSYFTNSEGRDEIISDIEARIAEMLQAKIGDQKPAYRAGRQVITIEDINGVISVMGEPEQIGAASESSQNGTNKKSFGERGVHRRLYRDPDNKVLGGVCGGIGAYFNIDPVWIRVALVIALFVFGSGLLLYIILWIIIPEAKTTAEKLEMRGEPVTISNIGNSIHEEMEGLKKRLKDLKDDAKSAYSKNFRKERPQTAIEKIIDFFLVLLKYFIRVVAIVIGIIFIVVGIFLITGFIISFVRSGDMIWISSMGISNFSLPVFLKLFLSSSQQITIALIGLALLIGVPLIMLVYNGIKLIFGFKFRKRIVGISSLSLWFAGLVLCIIAGLETLNSFSHKSVISKKTTLTQPVNNLLKVYVREDNKIDSFSEYKSKFVVGQWNLVSFNDKNMRFGLPELRVIKSENSDYQVLTYFSSRGRDKENAEKTLKKIEYKINQNDTALILDPYYILPENEKWRGQKIKIIIKVPLWKAIYLGAETSPLLNDDADIFDDEKDLSGKKWIMTDNGLREYFNLPNVATNDTLKK